MLETWPAQSWTDVNDGFLQLLLLSVAADCRHAADCCHGLLMLVTTATCLKLLTSNADRRRFSPLRLLLLAANADCHRTNK